MAVAAENDVGMVFRPAPSPNRNEDQLPAGQYLHPASSRAFTLPGRSPNAPTPRRTGPLAGVARPLLRWAPRAGGGGGAMLTAAGLAEEMVLASGVRIRAVRADDVEAARRLIAERRVTELYNAAAEQLGSDKAPVRLTAL